MDTKFWGPSGWKMLHLISFDYEVYKEFHNKKDTVLYGQFFETLPYILPCKFCRASLTDYYREHPFLTEKKAFRPSLDMRRWLYEIHNCVNDKLRKQGLNPNSNPSYSKIKESYQAWLTCDWQQHLTTFWDFLFAVAYNHPKDTASHSTPMPECPAEVLQCKDTCEKNKWNILAQKDRIYWFKRFWSFLPAVLPLPIRQHWEKVGIRPTLESRHSTLSWLWMMRCALDTDFKDPYTSVCKKIATYSSDCGKKKRAITCRRRTRRTTVKKTK